MARTHFQHDWPRPSGPSGQTANARPVPVDKTRDDGSRLGRFIVQLAGLS